MATTLTDQSQSSKATTQSSAGQPLAHESAIKHVSGQAVYIDDLSLPANTIYVSTGKASIAAGRLSKLDLDAVRSSPGVVDTLVFSDIPVLNGADYPLDWDNLRDMILTRDNYECTEGDGYCDGPLQIHHIVPLSKGGPNDPDNLTTLCFYHHSLKHSHMQRD